MARKAQPSPRNFEQALRELEQILGEIEAGEIGLDESITRYERGTFLIQHCRTVLGTAETQIELLSRGPQGELATEPLTDEVPQGNSSPAPSRGAGDSDADDEQEQDEI